MSARIDHLVTSGPFEFDGQTIDLENNVWIIGDDEQCLVVDAPHQVDPIVEAIGGRRVLGIVCTHAHRDHIGQAPALGARVSAPVLLHPDDLVVWRTVHDDGIDPDQELADGQVLSVAGVDVRVMHTPGHTPGSVSLDIPDLATVLTGDTLFPGGPGATGRPFSDFPTIIASVRNRLFTLDPDTRVLPGHGGTTTLGAESPHLDEWIARGH